MELSAEDKLILSCIKIHPSEVEMEQINSLILLVQDWDYLISTIIDRGIGPLLYQKLPLLSNSTFIPTSVKNKLQQVYYKTFSRSTILYEHFRRVAEAFRKQNIPVIALKGIYLSEWLYQDIGLRQFSDIDLLVKVENGKKSLEILNLLGYKPVEDIRSEYVQNNYEIIHYSPMILNGVSVEIHIKLHRITEKYHLLIDELWKNAKPIIVNSIPVYALNTNDLLIHLCIHLDKHFREGHVQFTCFNDITNLLESQVDNIDWNDFSETCRKYKCEVIVFKYLILVNKYMNASLPDNIIQKYNKVLTLKEEQLFIKYLNGYSTYASGVPAYLGSLKSLNSSQDKVRFIWEVVFPPKDFMINKYGLVDSSELIVLSKQRKKVLSSESGANSLENELQTHNWKLKLWWLWYPYRWWIGVKGFLRVIRGK